MILRQTLKFPLNRYIRFFWQYENNIAKGESIIRPFAVEGSPVMILHYGNPIHCRVGVNSWLTQAPCSLTGQIKKYAEILETGKVGMIAIVFYPDGLYPFIRMPVDHISEQMIDLTDVFGPETHNLREKICETDSAVKRFSLIEHFLLNRLKIDITYENKEILYCISQMKQQSKINLTQLSSDVNMSKRNLERVFLKTVGLTPVVFNRIIRFQKALAILIKQNRAPFHDAVFNAGYYDQSHFINDFKQFMGKAPTEFLQNRTIFQQ